MTASDMTIAETQGRLAQEFVDGFNAFTTEAILKPRADHCLHFSLPASLNRPPISNQHFTGMIETLAEVMKDFKVR